MQPLPSQNAFARKRQEGERNLILEVRNALKEVGLQQKVKDCYDQDKEIIHAEDLNPEAQRYVLNHYWNLQLMSVATPSTDQRYCLVNDGTFDDWLRLFRQVIRPFLLEHDLPKVL